MPGCRKLRGTQVGVSRKSPPLASMAFSNTGATSSCCRIVAVLIAFLHLAFVKSIVSVVWFRLAACHTQSGRLHSTIVRPAQLPAPWTILHFYSTGRGPASKQGKIDAAKPLATVARWAYIGTHLHRIHARRPAGTGVPTAFDRVTTWSDARRARRMRWPHRFGH